MDIAEVVEHLRCPVTARSLEVVDIERSDRDGYVPVPRKGSDREPISDGATDRMLILEDESFAYPIVDGVPVLLGPERLLRACRAAGHSIIDLSEPMYAEAYEEMEFYNFPHAFPPRRHING